MVQVSNEIPTELKEDWGRLLAGADERKLRRHLPYLKGAVAMVSKLEAALRDAFEGSNPDAVDPAKRSAARTMVVSSLQSHALSFGAVMKEFAKLSDGGQEAIRKVLGWIAEHLVKLFTDFSAHLGLQSWSVAAEFSSVPPGASFTFTLTFQ